MNFHYSKILHVLILLSLSWASVGCSPQSEESNLQDINILNQNQALWLEKQNGRNYVYNYRVSCYCIYSEYTVEVDGETDAVIRASTINQDGHVVVLSDFSLVYTVNKLFEKQRRDIQASPVEYRATYNATEGYTQTFYVDTSRQIADDEFGFTAESVIFEGQAPEIEK